ncbi:MAG TPA: hypothetical protein VEH27_19540, partial [Methylomirabilota bacterium]|nr:hypothetical protein [Methylomirabilota bacterium]
WDVSGQKRLLIGQTTDSPGEPMLNGVTADGRFILFSANTPGSSPAGAPAAPQAHLLDTDSKGIQGVGQSTQTTKTPFGHLLMTSRAVSADGRYVAFSTTHPHSPLDTNGVLDVYVRDVVEKRTILASASTNQAGSGASFDAVISPTGRHVAFLSATNNFTSATSTNRLGLYVKNLETAAVMMVDEPLQGGNSETLPGTYSFSADGNWIAYETKVGFAYLMNLATGERIGLMNNAAGETRGKAFLPTFSPDGGSVYFYSTAPDLVEPSQLGYFLFKRDLATGQVTRLATLIDSPATGRPAQLAFSVSTNGVMLLSTSNTIWRVEPGDTNRVQICSSCDQPALSPDGSAIVYRSVLGSSMKARLPDDRVITLPTISGGNINIPAGPGRDPVFSGDGAQVAYTVQRSGSGASIVHLYHFSSGKLEVPLPDQTNTNDPRNHVVNPNFTADGGKLYVLGSAALTEDDRNGTSDIFMLDLRADTIDSDQDGMPDAWEVTFFGNLLQGASDDFDQDGLSNLAEHRAGTSPSNAADVLQVVIFESLLEPRRVLRWRSKPGMRYVVEAKDRLDDAWRQVSLPITATGTTGFYQEEELQAESKHRFYRIRLVP